MSIIFADWLFRHCTVQALSGSSSSEDYLRWMTFKRKQMKPSACNQWLWWWGAVYCGRWNVFFIGHAGFSLAKLQTIFSKLQNIFSKLQIYSLKFKSSISPKCTALWVKRVLSRVKSCRPIHQLPSVASLCCCAGNYFLETGHTAYIRTPRIRDSSSSCCVTKKTG